MNKKTPAQILSGGVGNTICQGVKMNSCILIIVVRCSKNGIYGVSSAKVQQILHICKKIAQKDDFFALRLKLFEVV